MDTHINSQQVSYSVKHAKMILLYLLLYIFFSMHFHFWTLSKHHVTQYFRITTTSTLHYYIVQMDNIITLKINIFECMRYKICEYNLLPIVKRCVLCKSNHIIIQVNLMRFLFNRVSSICALHLWIRDGKGFNFFFSNKLYYLLLNRHLIITNILDVFLVAIYLK